LLFARITVFVDSRIKAPAGLDALVVVTTRRCRGVSVAANEAGVSARFSDYWLSLGADRAGPRYRAIVYDLAGRATGMIHAGNGIRIIVIEARGA
jgi:hypothetical protein